MSVIPSKGDHIELEYDLAVTVDEVSHLPDFDPPRVVLRIGERHICGGEPPVNLETLQSDWLTHMQKHGWRVCLGFSEFSEGSALRAFLESRGDLLEASS